jgi:Transposase DDE domain
MSAICSEWNAYWPVPALCRKPCITTIAHLLAPTLLSLAHVDGSAATAALGRLRAETAGLLPRWQGLRLVAADAPRCTCRVPNSRCTPRSAPPPNPSARCSPTPWTSWAPAMSSCSIAATPPPGSSICSKSAASASSCAAAPPAAAGKPCAASSRAARPRTTSPSAHRTAAQAPAHRFGGLYHQRWRVEEAFKRLKHRLHLEAVCGFGQHALMVDVAAKILADNLASLLARAAHEAADASPDRPCNLAYTLSILQRMAPRLLAFTEEIGARVWAGRGMIRKAWCKPFGGLKGRLEWNRGACPSLRACDQLSESTVSANGCPPAHGPVAVFRHPVAAIVAIWPACNVTVTPDGLGRIGDVVPFGTTASV